MSEIEQVETRQEAIAHLTSDVAAAVLRIVKYTNDLRELLPTPEKQRVTLLEEYHNTHNTELMDLSPPTHLSIVGFERVVTAEVTNIHPVVNVVPSAFRNLIPGRTYPFEENLGKIEVILGPHTPPVEGTSLTYEIPLAFHRCFGTDNTIYIFGARLFLYFKKNGDPYNFDEALLELGLYEVDLSEKNKVKRRVGLGDRLLAKALRSHAIPPTYKGKYHDLKLGMITLKQGTLEAKDSIQRAIEEHVKEALEAIEREFFS